MASEEGQEELPPPGTLTPQLVEKFEELKTQDVDSQCEYFLKSFIFGLGDDWGKVNVITKDFKLSLKSSKQTKNLEGAQIAELLVRHGKVRTGDQRRKELKEIDKTCHDNVCLLQYLMLYYKGMIIREFYKRIEQDCPYDLADEDSIVTLTGISGVLIEELVTMPNALSPALEKAIEDFSEQKKAKALLMEELTAKAEGDGVKAKAAKNQLAQIEASDSTETNRMEATLNAAKRKAMKGGGEAALLEAKKKALEEEEAKKAASKNRLKEKSQMFQWVKMDDIKKRKENFIVLKTSQFSL